MIYSQLKRVGITILSVNTFRNLGLYTFILASTFYFSSLYATPFYPTPEEKEKLAEEFFKYYNKAAASYHKIIKGYNPRLTDEEVELIAKSIIYYSLYFSPSIYSNRVRSDVIIDPRLVVALIIVESRFRIYAVSPKGAMGLGQLMPFKAKSLLGDKVLAFHPQYNIFGTIKELRNLFDRYAHLPWHKQYLYTLAAYNAGPGAVKKYNGVPPYRETQNFVRLVTRIYKKLAPELFK